MSHGTMCHVCLPRPGGAEPLGQLCVGHHSEVAQEAPSPPWVHLGEIFILQCPGQLVPMCLQRWRLGSMILKVFSNQNDSVILNSK